MNMTMKKNKIRFEDLNLGERKINFFGNARNVGMSGRHL